jgi:hypothetical protein
MKSDLDKITEIEDVDEAYRGKYQPYNYSRGYHPLSSQGRNQQ